MQKSFTPLVAFMFAILALAGCSKDDSISDTADLEGSWTITGIQSDDAYDWDGDGFQERDILSTYSPCDRDIVLVFEPNGDGQISEGCTDPFSYFSWQYAGNQLRLNLPSTDLDLEIRQFTSNTIRGADYVQVGGRNFQITYTLTRRERG
jgi:hypothetical protein